MSWQEGSNPETRTVETEKTQLKPVWKSLVFWMGALVTLFLVWAWVDSRGHRTFLGYSAPPRGLELRVADSTATVSISLPRVDAGSRGASPGRWSYDRHPERWRFDESTGAGHWFPELKTLRVSRYQGSAAGAVSGAASVLVFDGSDYFVPLWLIILMWLMIWFALYRLCRCWQRRRIGAN